MKSRISGSRALWHACLVRRRSAAWRRTRYASRMKLSCASVSDRTFARESAEREREGGGDMEREGYRGRGGPFGRSPRQMHGVGLHTR